MNLTAFNPANFNGLDIQDSWFDGRYAIVIAQCSTDASITQLDIMDGDKPRMMRNNKPLILNTIDVSVDGSPITATLVSKAVATMLAKAATAAAEKSENSFPCFITGEEVKGTTKDNEGNDIEIIRQRTSVVSALTAKKHANKIISDATSTAEFKANATAILAAIEASKKAVVVA